MHVSRTSMAAYSKQVHAGRKIEKKRGSMPLETKRIRPNRWKLQRSWRHFLF